jgi:hypothetical protein
VRVRSVHTHNNGGPNHHYNDSFVSQLINSFDLLYFRLFLFINNMQDLSVHGYILSRLMVVFSFSFFFS